MSRLLGIILRDDLGGILCRDNNDFRVLASYAHSADDDSILRHISQEWNERRGSICSYLFNQIWKDLNIISLDDSPLDTDRARDETSFTGTLVY